MLPISPFLDAWGERVAQHPDLSMEERAEILLAILEGLQKMPKTFAYARALSGFARATKGGLDVFRPYLPALRFKELKSKEIQQRLNQETKVFEQSFAKRALGVVHDKLKGHFPA